MTLSPRRERIVYTRPDGGVSIVVPAAECLQAMCCGGAWAGEARGFVDEQIERLVAAGTAEPVAVAFCRAMAFGGMTDREALAVISEKDGGGSGRELWDMSDVPSDRWFRDAWVRSHNGGPIGIDLTRARHVHFRRLSAAAHADGMSAAADLDAKRAQIDMDVMRERIRRSRDVESLRMIWPEGLARTA